MKKSLCQIWWVRLAAVVLLGTLPVATAAAQAVSSAANISTRMKVETGDNVLIGGFIITGTGQKRFAVRAIGPSLPVPGTLPDPILSLHDASGAVVASNDNWRSDQEAELSAVGLGSSHDLDAALIATLPPGSYTAVVRGVNSSTGVALVEVFDLDGAKATARLGNMSTRGHVLTNDDVMIGGFILRGELPKRMLLRVRGPTLSLTGAPIAGRMQDPTLELFDGNGQPMMSNDDWRSSQEAEIAASSIPPSDNREPAIVATLPPGNYTAIVRGKGGSTGIALFEMYDLDQPPRADGSTLYITQLRPQGGANSHGTGMATLRLAADELSAVFSFSFSNLTGPITAMHIHAATDHAHGAILFDPDEIIPQPDGTYIWVFQPTGGFSIADIVAAIKAGQTYFNIHTAAYPAGEITGHFNISHGAQVAPSPTPAPALPSGTPSPADAGRFLSQATFGATAELIDQVQAQGFDSFLEQQFSAPVSSHLDHVDSSGANPPTLNQTMIAWWTHAIAGPDQLRQRVAFALSQFFVVSALDADLSPRPEAMSGYMDVLVRGAFGNYRDLLEQVTLHPTMGVYLDMLGSGKANSLLNVIPNENYAREILQLFSIGLYRLHLDGSLVLDSQGFPIPTYDQATVLGFADAFTGWHYWQFGPPHFYHVTPNFRRAMISVPNFHETAAKTILDGVVIPPLLTPEQDLQIALDTIFAHPNVGPFVSRHLIQRLVTSNPSPGYVHRVASVFNNNGDGVRGDLRAVIRAILLDYDARGPAKTGQGAGHVREPVLRLTHLLRAFRATTPGGNFNVTGANALGQVPLQAPTVFNFFAPDYSAPGPIARAGLVSPELEITNETTVISTANYLRNAIHFFLGPNTSPITLNLTHEQALAADPPQLVAHLDRVLMASSMSPQMRGVLTSAITQIPASNPLERVRTGIYLVVNSPEYMVDR